MYDEIVIETWFKYYTLSLGIETFHGIWLIYCSFISFSTSIQKLT